MEKQKVLRPAVTAAKPLRSEQAKRGERSNEAEWRNRERRGILIEETCVAGEKLARAPLLYKIIVLKKFKIKKIA